jgi:hypothetical protein
MGISFYNKPTWSHIPEDNIFQISLVCIILDMTAMNVMVGNHMVHTKLPQFSDCCNKSLLPVV